MLFSCSRRPEVEKWWALFSWLSAQNMLDNYEGFLHYVLPTTRGQITLKKQVQDLIATVEQFGEGNGNALQYSCLENPWTEEPGRLQSMGSLRVGHDSATSFSLFSFMLWRRKWQPTPVFLPGESQGWQSLAGRRLWGHTESDTTEVT